MLVVPGHQCVVDGCTQELVGEPPTHVCAQPGCIRWCLGPSLVKGAWAWLCSSCSPTKQFPEPTPEQRRRFAGIGRLGGSGSHEERSWRLEMDEYYREAPLVVGFAETDSGEFFGPKQRGKV